MAQTINRTETDSISFLKGCGRATCLKLNSHKVYTYQDILDFTGSIPGVNIPGLQRTAREQLKNTIEIIAHNWYNLVCHVVRQKGQIIRAVIGKLIIGPHRITLNVTWTSRGKLRQTSISPVSILCTQILWLSNDIVSDDSGDESCDPFEQKLPKFLVEPQHAVFQTLSLQQLKAVHSTIKETNQLYNCV